MRNLRGYKKKYFKLSIIVMYSTLNKLNAIEAKFIYYKRAFKYSFGNKDPPNNSYN